MNLSESSLANRIELKLVFQKRTALFNLDGRTDRFVILGLPEQVLDDLNLLGQQHVDAHEWVRLQCFEIALDIHLQAER